MGNDKFSRVRVIAEKCKNNTEDATAPVCKTDAEITEWLEYSSVRPLIFNKKVNLKTYDVPYFEILQEFDSIEFIKSKQ